MLNTTKSEWRNWPVIDALIRCPSFSLSGSVEWLIRRRVARKGSFE